MTQGELSPSTPRHQPVAFERQNFGTTISTSFNQVSLGLTGSFLQDVCDIDSTSFFTPPIVPVYYARSKYIFSGIMVLLALVYAIKGS